MHRLLASVNKAWITVKSNYMYFKVTNIATKGVKQFLVLKISYNLSSWSVKQIIYGRQGRIHKVAGTSSHFDQEISPSPDAK